jgi:hypothetical protein
LVAIEGERQTPLEPKDIPEGAANLPIVIGLRLACSGQLERCLHVSL